MKFAVIVNDEQREAREKQLDKLIRIRKDMQSKLEKYPNTSDAWWWRHVVTSTTDSIEEINKKSII